MRTPLFAALIVSLASPLLVIAAEKSSPSEPPSFLSVPVPPGWTATFDESGERRVAGVQLNSADGTAEIDAGIFVLTFGKERGDHQSAAISSADWLPKGSNWLAKGAKWTAVGPSSRRCFWVSALLADTSGDYRYSGQARCRGENFAVIFNLFSRADLQQSTQLWRNTVKSVVLDSKTDASCLSPEEMTAAIATTTAPFFKRPVIGGGTEVALRESCGSGGCPCLRFDKVGKCFRFVREIDRCGSFEE